MTDNRTTDRVDHSPRVRDAIDELMRKKDAADNRTTEKKPPLEAKGDCTICKGWVDDGRGGTCIFTDDFWTPHCPYDKEAMR